jgi:hypothetical protein
MDSAYIDYEGEIIRGTDVEKLMEQDMNRTWKKKKVGEKTKKNE